MDGWMIWKFWFFTTCSCWVFWVVCGLWMCVCSSGGNQEEELQLNRHKMIPSLQMVIRPVDNTCWTYLTQYLLCTSLSFFACGFCWESALEFQVPAPRYLSLLQHSLRLPPCPPSTSQTTPTWTGGVWGLLKLLLSLILSLTLEESLKPQSSALGGIKLCLPVKPSITLHHHLATK